MEIFSIEESDFPILRIRENKQIHTGAKKKCLITRNWVKEQNRKLW